jgi:hypothetical protein
MASSKVIVAHARDVVRAKGTDMTSDVVPADCSDVCSTDATHAGAAEVSHVGSPEATAHMAASAEATTTVASASAATAGLRIRRNQTAGKQCSCQNHHHSSFHDTLL